MLSHYGVLPLSDHVVARSFSISCNASCCDDIASWREVHAGMFMHANKQTDFFLSISALSLNCITLKQISPQRPGSPRRRSAFRQTKPALQDRDAIPGDMALPIGLSACYIACICIVSFIFALVCHRKSHSGHRRFQRFLFVESCVRAFFSFFSLRSRLSLPKPPILFPVLHSLSTKLLFFHLPAPPELSGKQDVFAIALPHLPSL